MQEAIDLYLDQQRSLDVENLLELEGSLSPAEADEMARRIAEAWATWETA